MNRSRDAQRLLANYRDAIQPTPEQLDAIHSKFAPARRPRRVALGIGLAAAAALVVMWWAAASGTATSQAPDAPIQAPHEQVPSATKGQWRDEPRGVAPTPSPAPTTVPAPAPVPRRRAAPVQTPSAPSDPGPSIRLAAEAKLIRRAETLLRQDDAAGALEVLSTHARSFADGALVTERRALRAIALCRSGKQAQGRGEAAGLQRDPASRPYRDRIEEACK